MTGPVLQTIRVVVDPLAWKVLLIISAAAVGVGLIYLVRIHIAYRMAKSRRHRTRIPDTKAPHCGACEGFTFTPGVLAQKS